MVSTVAKEKQAATGFGGRLKALRLAAGMTQQQLADHLGMKANNVTRLESGDRNPSWDTVYRIAKVLGVSTDAFAPSDE